jgi:hypothetical protein
MAEPLVHKIHSSLLLHRLDASGLTEGAKPNRGATVRDALESVSRCAPAPVKSTTGRGVYGIQCVDCRYQALFFTSTVSNNSIAISNVACVRWLVSAARFASLKPGGRQIFFKGSSRCSRLADSAVTGRSPGIAVVADGADVAHARERQVGAPTALHYLLGSQRDQA